MFKFQDFDGKLLALRAEMTAPVARIVTTRMPSAPEPIRLFYITNVFRYNSSYLKNEREFYQAGVELVGCNTPEADGEILALLISFLKQIGLEQVRIDLGNASLLKDLQNAAGLDKKQKTALQRLLSCRDLIGLKKFMEKNKFPADLCDAFVELSRCRKLSEVSKISLNGSKYDDAKKQLQSLKELQKALVDYGIDDLVYFDFSLTRQIEYYTGMVFEASVPNLGLPLGSGGRYDKFIEKFGKLDLPATGFALEMGKLLQALTAQGFKIPKDPKTKVVVACNSTKAGVEAVNALRACEVVASLDVTRRELNKTFEYGKLTEADYVVFVESNNSPVTVYGLKSDKSQIVPLDAFIKSLGGKNR